MMKRRVADRGNLPSQLPIFQTITAFLALDRLKAPEWVFGAVGILAIFVWAWSIFALGTEEEEEIFRTNME